MSATTILTSACQDIAKVEYEVLEFDRTEGTRIQVTGFDVVTDEEVVDEIITSSCGQDDNDLIFAAVATYLTSDLGYIITSSEGNELHVSY